MCVPCLKKKTRVTPINQSQVPQLIITPGDSIYKKECSDNAEIIPSKHLFTEEDEDPNIPINILGKHNLPILSVRTPISGRSINRISHKNSFFLNNYNSRYNTILNTHARKIEQQQSQGA